MESRVWSGVSSLYQADLVQAVRQSADPEVDSDWLVVVVVVVCSLSAMYHHNTCVAQLYSALGWALALISLIIKLRN